MVRGLFLVEMALALWRECVRNPFDEKMDVERVQIGIDRYQFFVLSMNEGG